MVWVYCVPNAVRKELERGLRRAKFEYEVCDDPALFPGSAIELKPDIAVLYFDELDSRAEAGITALRERCAETKIIFGTLHPREQDAKSIEKGVFYYAGNSTSQELLAAVKAAAKSKGKS